MMIFRVLNQAVSILIVLVLALPVQSMAEEQGSTAKPGVFSKERLAQMLAPVALYPDALLSQILMASTYPLEIVEADRWIKKNEGLKDDALDQALVEREWDPSVKSLCHFPSILSALSDKITQTTRLGDAFLAQQNDVMAMVQELRAKAREAGNLKSTKEQNIVVEKETIIIESANPEVVYIPSYDPVYVYGPWWYPAYPPYYWWPAPAIIGSGVVFWPGIFVGAFIGSWCYFDWHNHYIYVDWHKTKAFHHHRHDRDGRDRWSHDSEHRRGIAYRDKATSRKFGQLHGRKLDSKGNLRGSSDRKTRDNSTKGLTRKDSIRNRDGGVERPSKGSVRDRMDRTKGTPESGKAAPRSGEVRERLDSEQGRGGRERNDNDVRESGSRQSGGQGDVHKGGDRRR